MERTISLNGQWTGRYWSADALPIQFEAVVPGCAHTDLLRAGILKDYFQGYAANDSQFIEKANFEYSREFEFDGCADGLRIVFKGLDTFCDVFLNEQKLGYCDDMFVYHSFDVSSVIKTGRNQLRVRFYSPIEVVSGYPEYPAAFTSERVHIRRMQCTFGWDWVDRFVTMGIIGDVLLEQPSVTEIDCVYVSTTHLDDEGAEIYIQADFEKVGNNTWLEWEIVSPDGETVWHQRRIVVEDTVDSRISIASPQLWWPNGYGEQPLYSFNVRVLSEDGALLSEKSTRFGIRTIRVLELFDKPGSLEYEQSLKVKEAPYLQGNDLNEEFSCFTVIVNGKKVFCKGA
ncbi:MAG: hypothetical protein IJD01_04825, partial [Clostridia bacterium]|nr:hypothetical protein [Clostridia bacterium]